MTVDDELNPFLYARRWIRASLTEAGNWYIRLNFLLNSSSASFWIGYLESLFYWANRYNGFRKIFSLISNFYGFCFYSTYFKCSCLSLLKSPLLWAKDRSGGFIFCRGLWEAWLGLILRSLHISVDYMWFELITDLVLGVT